MLGIIRVLTTENSDVLEEHGRKMKKGYGVHSETRCIPSQPKGIYDEETEQTAIPKIVSLARELSEDSDIDVITISCAADPALAEAREAVSVPVLGAGISGAHAALMIGERVGVIGITDEPPKRMKMELGNRFYSYAFDPTLRKTTDLFSEGAKEKLLKVSQNLIRSGADVILFACTGFSTISLKDYLMKEITVPVIDLVEGQAIAYQMIGRRVESDENQNI